MNDIAEQINLGKIPLPPGMQEQFAAAPKPEKPKGWWSFTVGPGSVQGVLDKLAADATVPSHWKQAIKSEVLERCSLDFNGVIVHAQAMGDLHINIAPQKLVL